MTPPLEPRSARRLEQVAARLPAGARMERTAAALVFRPAAAPKARVAFFTSCVMDVMFPRVNREVVRLLVLAGAEVIVPRAQTCCGALHAHAGLRGAAKRLGRRNAAAFAGEFDAVVTDSAGCGAALRELGHLLEDDAAAAALAARVRDVSEVLAMLGLPAPVAPLRSPRAPDRALRVAHHDPCHLAHAQKVRSQPRALIDALGVERVELANSDWCCGSAGVYNIAQPEMAEAQLRGKLDTIERSAADVVVASNPGCLLHMRRGASERGLDVEIVHLAELLGRAYPSPSAAAAETAGR